MGLILRICMAILLFPLQATIIANSGYSLSRVDWKWLILEDVDFKDCSDAFIYSGRSIWVIGSVGAYL